MGVRAVSGFGEQIERIMGKESGLELFAIGTDYPTSIRSIRSLNSLTTRHSD
jgi:hypothetical protein